MQLSWGMSLSVFFMCTFCIIKPYNESRDNWIAILSSALLFLVFLPSSFMKYNELLAEESEAYDLIGIDILLIIAYGSVIVLFLWWAYHQKDVISTNTVTMAKKALAGGSSLGRISLGGSSLADEADEDGEDEERKPKTKKPEIKKSHLAKAETFKKEFKANGGLKGAGAGRTAKKVRGVVDDDGDDQGGGGLEVRDIKVTDGEKEKEQESSFNLRVVRSQEGDL
ncbi:hypothetical protein TL16_g11867 [Triparma laevis f. inornata]|nr:hypothetical protein TL16_g11867 [Triparma laevis f. inornata]